MKKAIDFSADVKTWLEFATYDLKTAKWNSKGRIYTSTCYACQQAAEKALKALILAKGKLVPKVHSLDRLISEIKKLKIDTEQIEKGARELDKYYISTRYPGQYGGPDGLYDKQDAQEALQYAQEIIDFVKERT